MRLLTLLRRMRHALKIGSAASVLAASAVYAQPASVEMDEALAKYGPGIFPAVTRMEVCGSFRVLVAYWAGTDMLFIDETEPVQNESTLAVKRGFSIKEFNYYEESITIRELSCELRNLQSLRVTGKAHSAHSEQDYSFVLEMDTASGKYEYSDTQSRAHKLKAARAEQSDVVAVEPVLRFDVIQVPRLGQVEAVSGDVQRLGHEENRWVAVEKGYRLSQRDRFKIGAGASLTIVFSATERAVFSAAPGDRWVQFEVPGK